MKKIYIIAVLLITISGMYSCSDDHDPVYKEGSEKPAQINTPQAGKEYELDKDNKYEVVETFKWSRSEYAIPLGIRYILQADKGDGNFDSPVVITSLTDAEISFTHEEMNNVMEKLGLEPDVKSQVKLRVVSNAYGGEEGNVLLSGFPTLYSDVVDIHVTPFEEERAYPESLFMIGDEFGNWNWEDDGIVEMVPVNGKEGEFWCINYFTAGKGFKWAPKRAWANDFNALDTNTGFKQNGGNAEVETDGLYMVYINMKNSEIYIEPAKVYGIGDCFGGWDEGLVLFSVSGKTTSSTVSNAGELRMYAASSIATTDWWTREFIILGGKIVYRANGGDQERVQVAAGKTVTLDFGAGTGVIN